MAASEARVLVRTFTGLIPLPLVDDLAVIVSELATNVVHHSGLAPQDSFEIRMSMEPSLLRVEIRDEGLGQIREGEIGEASSPPERANPEIGSLPEGGRGLELVEALSSRFSVKKIDGTAAWAEIDLPSVGMTGPEDSVTRI
jgi:anti-sigma regulatory factor (Ser/Thr protein kinase)